MRRREVGWARLSVLVSVIMVGCHTYEPVDRAVPGSAVRVLIPVTSALDDANAAQRTVAIEGLVLESGDTLVLATETRSQLNQFREIVRFDTLRLASDAYVGLQLKEFSKGKSIGLGVAIFSGVAIATTYVFTGGSKNDDPGTPTPGPTPAVVVSGSFLSTIWGLLTAR